jgi:hypothetical protein
VLALVRRRLALAIVAVAVGVTAKLYPLLLAPTWLALHIGFGSLSRRTWLLLAGGGAAFGAAMLGALHALGLLLLPIARDVLLFRSRPFQLESTVGSLLLATGGEVVGSHGSFNVRTAVAAALAGPWDGLMALTLLALAVAAGRWASRHQDLAPAEQARAFCLWTAAALLVVLAESKVLSPQYLLWTVPFVGILPGALGQRAARLYLPTLLLTQLCYPIAYSYIQAHAQWAVALLLLRNGLLCALAFLLVGRALAPRSAEPSALPAALAS